MTANLWSSIPVAWQEGLSSCKPELEQIETLLSQNLKAGLQVVPEVNKIFAALAMSPTDVSVVVIGQDPYPTPSHAIGLAFAVPNETQPLPGSLRNIFKEVATDTGLESATGAALDKWVQQGVLLLNTSLTTNSGVRAAHSSWPWEQIVRAMIEHVVHMNPKVVGLLLGNHAKQFADFFDADSIVSSAHPSPLSASRGFLGSKPFTRVNAILASNSRPEIIW
jgi:uracil-DNA glycosylase